MKIKCVALLVGLTIYSCKTEAEKKINLDIQMYLKKATKNLHESKQRYLADKDNYITAITRKIELNDSTAREMLYTLKQNDAEWKEEIIVLQERNDLLCKRMLVANSIRKDEWERFKHNISFEVSEIEKALAKGSVSRKVIHK